MTLVRKQAARRAPWIHPGPASGKVLRSGTKVRRRIAGTAHPKRRNAPMILIRKTGVIYPLYRIFQSRNPVKVVIGVTTVPKSAVMKAPTSNSLAPVARYNTNDRNETGKRAWGKWTNIGW